MIPTATIVFAMANPKKISGILHPEARRTASAMAPTTINRAFIMLLAAIVKSVKII